LKKYFFTSLILLLSGAFFSQTIVNTHLVQVQGNMNDSVYEFLGIPFAKFPIGNLRWQSPSLPIRGGEF
jgi:hypothetical protein